MIKPLDYESNAVVLQAKEGKSCQFCFVLFDLILYVPVNNFSIIWDGSSWVEPELSKDKCVLFKDTMQ